MIEPADAIRAPSGLAGADARGIGAPSPDVGRALIGQRILLTGASGTLGYHVLEQLAPIPEIKVLVVKRTRSHIRIHHPCVELACLDFYDNAGLRRVSKRFAPTIAIHCAATTTQFDRRRWFEMIRFNVDVSLRLCEAVSHVAGCHFVYVSTGLAYRDQGRPLQETDPLDTRHPYGASKAAADLLMRAAAAEFDVPLTIVRPFSFTGVGDEGKRLFPSILRAAAKHHAVDLAPGDQIRDFCAAQDIAEGIVAACATSAGAGHGLRIFNLGSGSVEPLRTVIERVVADLELNVTLNFGSRPYLPFEPRFLTADTSRAREALGWTPRTRLSYAVWQLANEEFPQLGLRPPQDTP